MSDLLDSSNWPVSSINFSRVAALVCGCRSSLISARLPVRILQLSTIESTICLLGIVMSVFSPVRTLVLLKPMCSTTPITAFTFTRSPVKNGLSKKMMKEAIRFSKLSLAASASPAPTILNPVSTLPIGW